MPCLSEGMPCMPEGMPCTPEGMPCTIEGMPCMPEGMPCMPEGMPCTPEGMPCTPEGMPCKTEEMPCNHPGGLNLNCASMVFEKRFGRMLENFTYFKALTVSHHAQILTKVMSYAACKSNSVDLLTLYSRHNPIKK